EVYLGYSLAPAQKRSANQSAPSDTPDLPDQSAPQRQQADSASEAADVTWQLRSALEPLLKEKGQERVFYEIESPLIAVLADMEYEGIGLDAAALADFGAQLSKEIADLEKTICHIAGTTFNINSPRQLGQILFD